jgi:hypothetical protein
MQMCLWLLILSFMIPVCAFAQYDGSTQSVFRQEELDQMLAPIALYPDSLLIQILMAATYPVEVKEARQWADRNSNLQGDSLTAALEQQPWDASVKSLVNFPAILAMMSNRIDWTQNVGDAFLCQKDQVMAAIQTLRAKAYSQGNLHSTSEQVVTVRDQYIMIEPVSPSVVYVPTYNPSVVYGPWWYPAYPPYDYHPPGFAPVSAGVLAFGAGVACGVAWSYAWGNVNWPSRRVYVNPPRNAPAYIPPGGGARPPYAPGNPDIHRTGPAMPPPAAGEWRHDPAHRQGMAYKDPNMGRQFGQPGQPAANPVQPVGGMPPTGPNRSTGMQRTPTTGPDMTGPGRQPTDPRPGYSHQGGTVQGRPVSDPRPMPAGQNPTVSGRQPSDPRTGNITHGSMPHDRPVSDPRPLPANQNPTVSSGRQPSDPRMGHTGHGSMPHDRPVSEPRPIPAGQNTAVTGRQPSDPLMGHSGPGNKSQDRPVSNPRPMPDGQNPMPPKQNPSGFSKEASVHRTPGYNQPPSGRTIGSTGQGFSGQQGSAKPPQPPPDRKSGSSGQGVTERRQPLPSGGQSSEPPRQASTGQWQRSSGSKSSAPKSAPALPKAESSQPPPAPKKMSAPAPQTAPKQAAAPPPPPAQKSAAPPPPPAAKSAPKKPPKNKDQK